MAKFSRSQFSVLTSSLLWAAMSSASPLNCTSPFLHSELCSLEEPGSRIITPENLLNSGTIAARTINRTVYHRLFRGPDGADVALTFNGALRPAGLAAGDEAASPWSVWGDYAYTSADNDLASTAFESDLHNFFLGADYTPVERIVVGIGFGYETTDVDTDFNIGEQEIDGYTIAPYLGYAFNDILSIDISGGWSDVDLEQNRTDPNTLTIIRSDSDAERWFVAGNINALYEYQQWIFTGRLGVLYTQEDQDGFTETATVPFTTAAVIPSQTVDLGQFQAGLELARVMGDWEPYAAASMEYDFEREDILLNAGLPQPDNDELGFRPGVGLRYYGMYGITGALNWQALVARDDFFSHTVDLTLRVEF